MTLQEIQDTMCIIRRETLNYCNESIPTLDEIDSLSVFVALFTFMNLPLIAQNHVGPQWDAMIENTVKKIILENL